MQKTEFYPLSIDYYDDFDSDGEGVIRLFGRTLDGKRICVLDDSFSHYFWAIIENKKNAGKLADKILELNIKETKRVSKALNVTLHEKKFLGEKVHALQIEVNNPKAISSIYEKVKRMEGVTKCLEIDITFVKRYLMDKNIIPLVKTSVEGVEVKKDYEVDLVLDGKNITQEASTVDFLPRILAFDIEVYNKRRSPNSDEDPIVMLSFYGKDNYKKVITWKKFEGADKNIEFVKDEGELILRFKEVIEEFKPDYLAGYFSDGFDFPYIRDRADQYGIKLDVGLDGRNVRFNRRGGNTTARVNGFAHIDIFKFIRRIMSGELNLPAYDLDSVASHLLGKGKSGADISKLYKVWDEGGKGIGEYCKYNLIDSERTYELVREMLPHLHEFVKLCGLSPEEISRMSYGQLVENYVMRNIESFNELIPNRPHYDAIKNRESSSIEGAFVYEPTAGVYEDIAVLDFKSLYPTIISAHNVCTSTLTDNRKESNKSPEILIGKNKINYFFNFKYDGIFPKIIREILIRRNRVKEMLQQKKNDAVLNARQYSLKVLANSAYGYLAFSGARWYCKECAAATTAYGRDYIQKLIERAKKEKLKVIYGDSVCGKSLVWVKQKGEIFEVEIEKLFEKIDLRNDTGKEYNFKEKLEVLTLDEKGKSVFKPLIYVMRHKCDKQMYRVNFTNNWSIDVTEDHSLMGYESLANTRGQRKDPLRRIIELRPTEIKKRANSIISMKKILVENFKSKNYSKEVYEFMGLFVGDGSFQRNSAQKKAKKDYYLGLSLGTDSEEIFKKNITPLIDKKYVRNFWWSKSRKGDLKINGLKLVSLISKHCSDKSHKKIIPSWLLNEPPENISAFLRGLFTADGTVMVRNNSPIIKFTSINRNYITMVRKLLYSIGISHSMFKDNTVNTYKTKNKIYSSGSHSKNILIKDKDEFNKKVGFLLDRKNTRALIKTNPLKTKLIKNYEFDIQGVKSIDKIKTPKYVYDIEVESTHRFFANYVLVHNTDSIFISLGKGKNIKDAEKFLRDVNNDLPSLMELELDGFYKRGIFVMKKGEGIGGAKKKYALIDEKDSVKVVGFETVRGDWSKLAKEAQQKVLKIILIEDDINKAVKYVKNLVKDIRSKKVSIDKMIIKKQLKKEIDEYSAIGPHVNVAKKLVARGEFVSAGSEVKYVVQEGKGSIGDRALPDDEAKDYDADYYINNQLIPVVDRIFYTVGFGKDELIKIHKQKSLGDY
jgi:DNA polymerase elongation subunit (family B)